MNDPSGLILSPTNTPLTGLSFNNAQIVSPSSSTSLKRTPVYSFSPSVRLNIISLTPTLFLSAFRVPPSFTEK